MASAFKTPKLERGLANDLRDAWDVDGNLLWTADLQVHLAGNQGFRLGPCTGRVKEVRNMRAEAEAEAVRWWKACLKAAAEQGIPWYEIDPMTVL